MSGTWKRPKRQQVVVESTTDLPVWTKRQRKFVHEAFQDLPACTVSLDKTQFQCKTGELDKAARALILEKRRLVDERLRKPVKVAKSLRVSIDHTHHSQDETESYWCLRIDGELLDSSQLQQHSMKFTSFFKKVEIEVDASDPVAEDTPDETELKWVRRARFRDTDGFEFRVRGDKEASVRIILTRNNEPARFRLSSPLRRLTNECGEEDTMDNIIKAVTTYIWLHGLLTADRRTVVADQRIMQVFMVDKFPYASLVDRLREHLNEPEPIIVNYRLTLPGEPTSKLSFDMKVDVDDDFTEQLAMALKGSSGGADSLLSSATTCAPGVPLPRFNAWSTAEQDNYSASQGVRFQIGRLRRVTQELAFYRAAASAPQRFIPDLFLSQCRDLHLFSTEDPGARDGIGRTDARSSPPMTSVSYGGSALLDQSAAAGPSPANVGGGAGGDGDDGFVVSAGTPSRYWASRGVTSYYALVADRESLAAIELNRGRGF